MTDATWDGYVNSYFDVVSGNGPSGPGTNWYSAAAVPNGTAIFPSTDELGNPITNTHISWQVAGVHPIQTMQFTGGLLYTFSLASGDMLSISGTGLVNASGQTFNVGLTSQMIFSNSATAGAATINANFGGNIFFNNGSSAGSSVITINAGAATPSVLWFTGTSSAGSATISVDAELAQVLFTANSVSASSNITINNNGLVNFNNESVGGSGTITIETGSLSFLDTSYAGGLLISDSGTCTFYNSSDGGNAYINIKSGGSLSFVANSLVDNAQINLNNGGTLDISGHSGNLISAPIGGSGGNIVLGSNMLIIDGTRGGASIYGGTISGSGGFTYSGPGNFVLNGMNTFTGGTAILGGTLELGSSGSVAGNISFQNGTAGQQLPGNEQLAGGDTASSASPATSAATLKLDAPNQISGTIVGYGAGDTIDFAFHNFTTGDHSVWTPNATNTGGTLSLASASGAVITSLNLAGTYTSASFSLTVDGNGDTMIGSTATLPTTVQQEILGLYSALYNRATDFNGVTYWAGIVGQQPDGVGVTPANAGTTPITINDATVLGQQFVNTQSTYFNATYGNLSDTAFITALYTNIGGNATNIAAGVTYWVNLLQAAEAAGQSVQAARAGIVGQIVQDMIDYNVSVMAPGYTTAQWEAVVQRQETINNKIAVSLALSTVSQEPGGNILVAQTIGDAAFNAATTILQSITYNPATVETAITGINAAVAAQNLHLI